MRHTEFDNNASTVEKKQILLACQTKKYWHDHDPLAGKSHFMVLVTCIYDPALYYTQQELVRQGMSVDVIGTVEKPQVHILAQQMMYNNTRSETLHNFDESIQNYKR